MTAGTEKQNEMVLEDLTCVSEEVQVLTLYGFTAQLMSSGGKMKWIQ